MAESFLCSPKHGGRRRREEQFYGKSGPLVKKRLQPLFCAGFSGFCLEPLVLEEEAGSDEANLPPHPYPTWFSHPSYLNGQIGILDFKGNQILPMAQISQILILFLRA